jgi:hypothetical protein
VDEEENKCQRAWINSSIRQDVALSWCGILVGTRYLSYQAAVVVEEESKCQCARSYNHISLDITTWCETQAVMIRFNTAANCSVGIGGCGRRLEGFAVEKR